jgi:hypothetical protein
MVAEVCSLYVLRADGVLELYATEGLNPDAVHHAQLRLGQGLVGTIAASARALNLSDAQKHPAFAYLPETGEEIYTPSSACRCCAPAARLAFSSCRTRPCAKLSRRRDRGAGNDRHGDRRDDRHPAT